MPDDVRVLHVNDCAGVARVLVDTAREQGRPWSLHLVPGGVGLRPRTAWPRLLDVRAVRREAAGYDVLHVHYGLMAYYAAASRRPFVLHLHGSDVTANLSQRGLSTVVSMGIKHAAAVFYSTPDLGPAVRALRSDARWLPAPVRAALLHATVADVRTARPSRVLFASRWDDVKGVDALLDSARWLRAHRPEVELVGADWGSRAQEAARAGVELTPVAGTDDYLNRVRAADVVVGQAASGVLGVSEIEAMAIGRPVVMPVDDRWYDRAVPVAHAAGDAAGSAVARLLDAPNERAALAAEARAWVAARHDPERSVQELLDVYRSVSSTAKPG